MRHDWEFMEMPGKEHWYCHRCGGKSPTDPGHGGYCKPDWAWHEAQRYKAAARPKPATKEPREWQRPLTQDEMLIAEKGPYFTCHRCGDSVWSMDRHAPHCRGMASPAPSETGLWDRLRADLNNLGAAYGPITEGVGEAVVTPGPVEICGCCKETGGWHAWRCESGPHPASLYPDKPTTAQLSQADRNAYFDGIILAARKRRESRYAFYDDLEARPLFSVRMARDEAEQEKLKPLARAMSRPLDFEPRVGHKGVEIDG